jgi:Protein of unknown function (DUF2510)
VLHLTGTQLIILVVLSFLWAALGYRLSENDRKTLGRTPWGLPSVIWALFWFLSLLLGLILYLFAHFAGVRRAQQNPPVGAPTGGSPSSMGIRPTARPPSVAEQFPAYPQPANLQPSLPGPDSAPAPTPVVPPGSPALADPGSQGQSGIPQSWPHSPPAWHPDPSGRFHFRWWDGYQWTSQVSTDGHHLIDTNPDQRIGPY